MSLVTPAEVIARFTRVLQSAFPDVPVQNTDITEGFKRPCFFLDLEGVDTGRVGTYYEDGLSFRLYYFAADTYKGFVALLKKRDAIIQLLQDTTRLDPDENSEKYGFVIQADDTIRSDINQADKVLQIAFTVDLVQDDDRLPDAEIIDSLEFKPSAVPSTDTGRSSTEDSSESDEEEDKTYKVDEL